MRERVRHGYDEFYVSAYTVKSVRYDVNRTLILLSQNLDPGNGQDL